MWIKQLVIEIKNRLQLFVYLRLSPRQIEKKQKKILVRILKSAAKNVPFYNTLLSNIEINTSNCFDVLYSLPIICKSDLRNCKNRIAKYVDDTWPSWHNTGGSTGQPLHFPIGGGKRRYLNCEIYGQAYLYKCMTGSYNVKIASVDGRRVTEDALSRNIFWGTNAVNFPYGKKHYSTMYLSEETFPYYLKDLNDERPDVLRGYPSGIYELARYIKKSNNHLNFKLKAIYLTSENILDYQVELIKDVFSCDIWGQYGHSEASIFAIRRPHTQEYHCLPLYGITEIIKQDGSHAQVGEIGEIVVTGFQYFAMPFIRYRTGDMAEYGGRNGSAVIIKSLIGRSNDYIITKDHEKIYLVGFIFGSHFNALNYIDEWQIVQSEPGKLELLIVKGKKYKEQQENEIYDFFSQRNFEIKIDYIQHIEKTSRGKQKFLIQRIIE